MLNVTVASVSCCILKNQQMAATSLNVSIDSVNPRLHFPEPTAY